MYMIFSMAGLEEIKAKKKKKLPGVKAETAISK